MRSLSEYLRIQDFVLRHGKGCAAFDVCSELLMSAAISQVKARQKFREGPRQISHLKGFGFGMQCAIRLPNLYVDGAGITGKNDPCGSCLSCQ